MNRTLIDRLPRIEGYLKVVLSQTQTGKEIQLQSGRSTHLESRLKGKYPLEAPYLVQSISDRSSVAHAIASVSALEDYLNIYAPVSALKIRQIMLDLSAIRSHIYHFYWEVLPDFLNMGHFAEFNPKETWFYFGQFQKEEDTGDLDLETGVKIMKSFPEAAKTIDLLQKSIALFGGKFPIIMNQIPGGVSNFKVSRNLIMKITRNLEACKHFVESIWADDLKIFIQNIENPTELLIRSSNYMSFGSLAMEQNRIKSSNYSEGVYINGKKEPVNELKITETLANTYFLPIEKSSEGNLIPYDFNKPNATTWIKGARYNGETMITGALSRMMITHLVGGNLEISDLVSQMIDDLELSDEAPHCFASRLLSEMIESRIYLKNVFTHLFDIGESPEINRNTKFQFGSEGVGVGKVESPSGSLMHQVYVKDNRISAYVIVSPMNWNFSPEDEAGNKGIVESELSKLAEEQEITPIMVARHLHSYNTLVLDGTR